MRETSMMTASADRARCIFIVFLLIIVSTPLLRVAASDSTDILEHEEALKKIADGDGEIVHSDVPIVDGRKSKENADSRNLYAVGDQNSTKEERILEDPPEDSGREDGIELPRETLKSDSHEDTDAVSPSVSHISQGDHPSEVDRQSAQEDSDTSVLEIKLDRAVPDELDGSGEVPSEEVLLHNKSGNFTLDDQHHGRTNNKISYVEPKDDLLAGPDPDYLEDGVAAEEESSENVKEDPEDELEVAGEDASTETPVDAIDDSEEESIQKASDRVETDGVVDKEVHIHEASIDNTNDAVVGASDVGNTKFIVVKGDGHENKSEEMISDDVSADKVEVKLLDHSVRVLSEESDPAKPDETDKNKIPEHSGNHSAEEDDGEEEDLAEVGSSLPSSVPSPSVGVEVGSDHNNNAQITRDSSPDSLQVSFDDRPRKAEDGDDSRVQEVANDEQDGGVPAEDTIGIVMESVETKHVEDADELEKIIHGGNATKKVVEESVESHMVPSDVNGRAELSSDHGGTPDCAGESAECSPVTESFPVSTEKVVLGPSPDSSVANLNPPGQGEGERFVNDAGNVAVANESTVEKFVLPESFMEKDKETASLAFVFDTTGSMHDDLMQAREGAKAILRAFLEYETIPVSNYILVPFNDPLVGPVSVSEDPEDFVKALDQLEIYGGDDCPEMSTVGILQALQNAYPNSFLYVFTDAPAKDYQAYNDVVEVVQRKHAQVNFFLSGLCTGKKIAEEAYKVYNKIAMASGGQVFIMTKDDISSAMDFLRQTLRSRSVTVYSLSRPEPIIEKPHSEDFNITVENDLDQLTVILTGNQPTIDVRNPSGETPKAVKTILDLPNAVVVNVDDPKPGGTWTVNITIQPKEAGSKSKTIPDGFTLAARGTGSPYQILYGFSVQPAGDLKETAKRPLEGTENYLTVQIYPLVEDSESSDWLKKYNWKSVDFLKMDGGVIWSLPLRQINGTQDSNEDEDTQAMKFVAGPFSPPAELITLSFHGADGGGNPVTRVSSNAISPQEAAPPIVTVVPQVNGFSGKNLSIHCLVESLLPFTLEWYKDELLVKGNLSFNQSSDALLKIANLTREDGGTYVCKATNSKGSTLSSPGTTVDIIEPPSMKNILDTVNIIPENNNVLLDCEVESDLNISIKWTYEHEGQVVDLTSVLDNHKYQLLKNNSLFIPSFKHSDSGIYTCSATNIAGTTSTSVELQALSPPEIVISPADDFYFTKGEEIVIQCKILGERAANISWEFDGITTEEFSKPSSNLVSVISIPNVDEKWNGRFVCVAVNEAGKAHKEVKGIYFEPPVIERVSRPFLAIKEGEDATISCSSIRKSNMSVSWLLEDNRLSNSEKYLISPDGLSLTILNVREGDEGVYTCEAHGMRGTKDSAKFEVLLGKPPKPRLIPYDTSLRLGEDGWFNCSAENQGDIVDFPEMAVRTSWKRENGVPLDLVRHEVLDSGTLHIIDADISDEGIYVCTLENDFGKTEHDMELQLTGFTPPLITGMLHPNLSVSETKSVLLNCTVISDSDYEVRWIHHRHGHHEEIPTLGDERILKLENKSLLILNLNEYDSGTYECRAGNRAGETTKEVELFVILPPKVRTVPEHNFEFFKGERISLDCIVDGDITANISWEFNGLSLKKLSKPKNASTLSVTIPYADEEWEGIYVCIAINEAGKVQKEVLGMYVQPPELIPESKHVAVKEGGIAEIKCIMNGISSASIIWLHNGQILANGLKYEISSDGEVLRVFESHSKDEGVYECVVEGPKNSKSTSSINVMIGQPPKPKQPYPYASLKIGEEGLFPCLVEDESEINMFPGMASTSTWKRKNKPLDAERHSITEYGALLITNATTSDDGVYICTLENDFGKIDLEMNLEIIGLVPPVITHYGDDEELAFLNGESITLWCNASGLPNPIVSWFYKSERMSDWERLGELYYNIKDMSITGGKLSIRNASYDNQGLYSCTAENDAGFAEKIHVLKMIAPPVLMDNGGPVDISLMEGESFSLQCTAKGVPEPTVKWIKDSMELPKESFDGSYHIIDGGAVLEILMAQSGKSDGYYTCSAENSAGNVQKSFKVKVLVPPAHGNSYLTRNLAILRVKLHDPITITCPIATGVAIPAPTYGWFKDGKMLHPEQVITSNDGRTHGHLQINDNGKTLHIEGVTLDDAGNYSCVGFNKAGRVVSPAAEVIVSIAPTHVADANNSSLYEAIKGENITFNCSVIGIPKPKVVWTKDGSYLSENQPYLKVDYFSKEKNVILSQLTISNIQGFHSGLYKCLSNNPVGKSSTSYDLNVLSPPYVYGQENNILEVSEGKSITLTCAITGNPEPNITWYKISNGHHEKLRKNRIPNPLALEISNLHKDDTGIYVCSGTNSIGSVKMSFNVSVLVAPSLDGDSPLTEVVAVGDNITLKCSPSGSPNPTLRWFKNGYLIGTTFRGETDIPNGNSIVISKDGKDMVINNASKDDDGNYTCISYNKAGKVERNFYVETIAQPLILDWNIPDVVKVLNGSKVSFDCSATGKPTPRIEWTRISPRDNLTTIHKTQDQPLVDSRGVSASTVELAFESILPEDGAVYICKAENKAGSALKRFHLDVHVPPFVEGYAGDENGEPNRIGVIKKQPGSVTVQVVAGQTFTLSCRILFGRPSPHLLWLRNGKKILKNIHQSNNPFRYTVDDHTSIATHGVFVIDSDETLVISNITEAESGAYKCGASNEAGTSEVNFNVEVFVPPSLEEGTNVETVFSVKVYSFIALVCPVTGNPVPDIKWFKDSEEIDEEYANVFQMSQDKRRLIIMQAKVENTGEYTCVATNEAGTKKINYKVSVLDEQSEWSPWSPWSACTSSCGSGTRKRYRECTVIQPNLKHLVPSYYHTSDNQIDLSSQPYCPGEDSQVQKCVNEPCQSPAPEEYRVRSKKKKVKRVPKRASLNLHGKLNGQPISSSHASASFNPWNSGPTLEAEVEVDPYQQGNLHPYMPFILSPVTWSAAGEIDDASNGYSLTDGVFEQRSQLEFMSGETLYLSHKGQGVDTNTGELKVEIEVEGEVPQYQSDAMVYLTPYSESYVQTSPSSLYAWTENDLNVDGKKIPYRWNSSLHYDSSLGTMSYLAEQLSLDDMNTYNDYDNHKIVFSSSPKISKKFQTNRCPDGFNSDEENLHCIDIDECADNLSKCHESQRCKNEVGGYLCLCPEGFTSKALGHPCIDINECLQGKNPCSHDCHNTRGSYYCTCPKGLELQSDKVTCERRDSSPPEYEKTKLPMLDLLPDYHIIPLVTPRPPAKFWSPHDHKHKGSGYSKDNKEEIQELRWADDEFNKKCSSGFEFVGGSCQDIDECKDAHRMYRIRHQSHHSSPCPLPSQQCVNTNGSYHCIEMSCPLGHSEVEVDVPAKKESLIYCLQLCDTSNPPCQEKAEVAQIVINSILTIGALKPRRALAQFSVPITARNSHNEAKTLASTTRTTFHKLEEETGSSNRQVLQLFRVRSEGTDGILYSMKEFNVPGFYRVAVMALTYNGYSHHVLYATKFVLNVFVTGH
ncbi:hemicentin-1-like isoform X2 [Ischnura elegans]|uniref:hemicentin-1-like isoform X2 n=1 Tax=Ischnura elegans TaxID=197161 RepID=UPI001ED8A405|nr:hemicentin-1-like isoform X2 [Ischnura elegans]